MTSRLSWLLLLVLVSPAHALDSDVLRNERPDPEDVPTPVDIAAFVVDVSRIDNARQSFSADIVFLASWKDERLAGSATRTFELEEVWHPRLGIVNERDLSTLLPEQVTVAPDGTVTYRQRTIGEFSVRMDLRRFPRDVQTPAIVLGTYGYSPAEIELRAPHDGPQGLGNFSVPAWSVELAGAEIEPLAVPGTGREVATIALRMIATRDTGYYHYTMYLPLVFIVLMAWSVFWIDPSVLPPQIALSSASIFSLIAFRFSLGLHLPPVSYMTRLDSFVLGCTVLVFVALAKAILTHRLVKRGREESAQRVDRWGRWIYLAAIAGLTAVFV